MTAGTLVAPRGELLSIITVNLNNLQGLQNTVESVLRQSRLPLELIVVDGASSDGSSEWVSGLLGVHDFISVICEPDEGIYDAMNKGVRASSGELIQFLNSGDALASDDVVAFIEDQHTSAPFEWAYGCSRTVDNLGRLAAIGSFVPFRRDRLALGLSVVPHQAVVMRRGVICALGGFDTSAGIGADQDLCYRVSLLAQPHLWAKFIVDFEGGGIGSSSAPGEFARNMSRARRHRGQPILGSDLLDGCVTSVVIMRAKGVALLSHLRRSMLH